MHLTKREQKERQAKKKQRIIKIEEIHYVNADINLIPTGSVRERQVITGEGPATEANTYYITPTYNDTDNSDSTYYFPYLLEEDQRTPFEYGNLFLWSLISNAARMVTIDADSLHRKASHLLDFKMFVEDKGSYLLDFDARRPVGRITYKYFNHLVETGVGAGTINKKTKVVFEFYQWLSKQPEIDLDFTRVETTRTTFLSFKGPTGSYSTNVEVRSQTVQTPPPAPVQDGYVRDEGEDLRPLSKKHEDKLWLEVSTNKYSLTDRLIFEFALDTGARKQTILTLRMKHLDLFTEANLMSDHTYKLAAGPGTDIDTKNSKRINIYVPKMLADKLKRYAKSKASQAKRAKFKTQYPERLSDDNMYVFLSNQGNCFYMAKNDPLWPKKGSSVKGAYLQSVVNKIKKSLLDDWFPQSFTFHWSRATFAMRYFEYLEPDVQAGSIARIWLPNAVIFLERNTRLASKD